MLSSSPPSCTSPNPDGENPSKKVQWAPGRRRTSSTDSESKPHPDLSRVPRSRRPSRLTVKYDRGQLQRWLEVEEWVDVQVQELFQLAMPLRPVCFLNRINQPLLSLRLTWRLLRNYPQRSRRLIWRPFSKTAPAPQSSLSQSYSVNSRNSRDSAGLTKKPCDTTCVSLSTAQACPEHLDPGLWRGLLGTQTRNVADKEGHLDTPSGCAVTASSCLLGFLGARHAVAQ
ncbi:protein phosphatase 1 regulatory subunit 14D isoform 1-T1 [Trichechus inunguis]